MTIGDKKSAQNFDQLYPGRFLKSGLLLDKKVTLTISDVFLETLPDDKIGEKDRGIICFKETPMQLALNRTNGECLKAMFTKKVQSWKGKRVTLAPEMTKFGREDVEAIRIYGSPDISNQIDLEIRMPKRKPQKRSLYPTGKISTGPAPQPEPRDNPQETSTAPDTQEKQEEVKQEEVSQ